MTPTRYSQVLQGLNGLSKQVLGVLPVEEPIPVTAIVGELTKQGKARDTHVVRGALRRLVDAGVALEPAPHLFRHVTVRGRAAAKRKVSVCGGGIAVEQGDLRGVVAAQPGLRGVRPPTATELAMQEALQALEPRQAEPQRPELVELVEQPRPEPEPAPVVRRAKAAAKKAPGKAQARPKPRTEGPHALDELGAMAGRLRTLSTELARMADDMEAAVALACEAELATLERLQATLRKLAGS